MTGLLSLPTRDVRDLASSKAADSPPGETPNFNVETENGDPDSLDGPNDSAKEHDTPGFSNLERRDNLEITVQSTLDAV